MNRLKMIIMGIGGLVTFLSITSYPILAPDRVSSLSWTRESHVAIGFTLLRAMAILLVTFAVTCIIPRKKGDKQ